MFGRGPRQQPQAGGGNQQQPQMERGSVSRDPRVLISILRMKARAMGNERWRGTYHGMHTKKVCDGIIWSMEQRLQMEDKLSQTQTKKEDAQGEQYGDHSKPNR